MMKRFLLFFLILALAAGMASPALAAPTLGQLEDNLSQAQQEYQQEAQKLEENQQQVQNMEDQVEDLEGQADVLQNQLVTVYNELETQGALLAQAQQEAAQAQADADQAQAEYDQAYERGKDQLAAMQELHDGGDIALLGQLSNLYQLLTFGEVLQDMTRQNQSLLEELSQKAAEYNRRKEEADQAAQNAQEAQDTLSGLQEELNQTSDRLAQALEQSNQALESAQAQAQAQEAITQQAKAAWLKAQAEVDAYVNQQSGNYTPPDLTCELDFRCPLNSYSYISCYYGETDYKGANHGATDFAAPGGTPIYAAAAGVVSVATTHNSYGNYVQISHGTDSQGRRFDTLYAHMQSYCVAVGQQVEKGQLIGYVGNTGDVVGKNGGYHLHLELRVNGSKVDPLSYISSK